MGSLYFALPLPVLAKTTNPKSITYKVIRQKTLANFRVKLWNHVTITKQKISELRKSFSQSATI